MKPINKYRTSHVWSHFRVIDSVEKIAKCIYCERLLTFKSTVTNLKKHMHRRHKTIVLPTSPKAKNENNDDHHHHPEHSGSPPSSLALVSIEDQANQSPNTQAIQSTSDMNQQVNVKPISKYRTSYLWSYFTIANSEERIAKCNYCGQLLTFKSTISNLKKHIHKRHKTIVLPTSAKTKNEDNDDRDHHYSRFPSGCLALDSSGDQANESLNTQAVQPTISSEEPIYLLINESISIPVEEMSGTNNLDKLLMQLFIHGYHPFSIVEDEAFVNLVKGLNPNYNIPSTKTIKSVMVPSEYNECQNALNRDLVGVNSVCLSIDIWTFKTLDSYLGVTAHYIKETFELRSVLLDCSLIPQSHTSVELAEIIRSIAEKFHLIGKVSVIVSDNTNSMKVAIIKELEKEHFVCFAHTLNLILQEAFKTANELIDKIKCIVRHFKKSSSSLEKLNSAQRMTFGLEPKKLAEEISTRWNSTFYMIQRFFELQDAIKAVTSSINEDLPVLAEDEWAACKELCIVLEPFEEVTEEISNEHYVKGSLLIPLTNGLKSVCERMQEDEFGPIAKGVIAEILNGINTRMFKIEDNKSLALATFLDPRFKLALFLNEISAQSIKEYCINLMADMWAQQQETEGNVEANGDNSNQGNANSNSSLGRLVKFSVWENINKTIASKKSSDSMQVATTEVNRYMEDCFLGRKEDPLIWWKNNHQYYPLLSKLVKTKFNVMGTSLPCQMLFTKAGNLIAERRSCLKKKNIDKILFLNANSFLMD